MADGLELDGPELGGLSEYKIIAVDESCTMAIYGTALLSVCLLVGMIVGKILGIGIGVDANVGGVGIAMLMLIVVSDRLQRSGHLSRPSHNGVLFWSSIYIPIVVAMAASQNVRAAVTGGPAAIVAGVLVVLASFALVPVISQLGQSGSSEDATSTFSEGDDS